MAVHKQTRRLDGDRRDYERHVRAHRPVPPSARPVHLDPTQPQAGAPPRYRTLRHEDRSLVVPPEPLCPAADNASTGSSLRVVPIPVPIAEFLAVFVA